MPAEVLEYLREQGKKYGSVGGKKSARNMSPEDRSARAKKASEAAALRRTAARLERERAAKRRKH